MKSSSQRAPVGSMAASPTAESVAVPSRESVPRIPPGTAKARFIPAALLMTALTLGLAWLASTTANPVVISPPQIQTATCVVVGEVLKTAENRVRVVTSLKGPLAEGTVIRVGRLPAELLQGERQWILALEHLRDDRFVVVVPDARYETAPESLVYPATPPALAQVRHWLETPWPTRDVPPKSSSR
jgi:hypothetical protein